jgi:FkbM family methyltransferase
MTMSTPTKIKNKLMLLYRQFILRDPFLREVNRWFKARGDETLRLNYPLTPESIVFDLGGYHGDFAAAIHERYGCTVYVFEPVPSFYQKCVDRFQGNEKIICLNYGLSSREEQLNITLAENASSFSLQHTIGAVQLVQLRSVVECIRLLNIEKIGLMKINIEGGEFDVLPALIKSGQINIVKQLQVQFHNFVEHAVDRRSEIRTELEKTHVEMWNYEFVWESWALKRDVH